MVVLEGYLNPEPSSESFHILFSFFLSTSGDLLHIQKPSFHGFLCFVISTSGPLLNYLETYFMPLFLLLFITISIFIFFFHIKHLSILLPTPFQSSVWHHWKRSSWILFPQLHCCGNEIWKMDLLKWFILLVLSFFNTGKFLFLLSLSCKILIMYFLFCKKSYVYLFACIFFFEI